MKPTLPPSFAEKDLSHYLRMIRGDFAELEEGLPERLPTSSKQKNIVIFLGSKALGRGNEELGLKLTKLFLAALANGPTKPRAIILVNDAVELSIEGSPVISELTVLSEQGVQVFSCLSSLDEIQAEEKISVGSQADMAKICEVLLTAWKVVSL